MTRAGSPVTGGPLRRTLPAVAGIAIAALLLYWATRGVDIDAVGTHIRHAKLLPLAVAVVLATLTFPIRLIRWRLLLRDEQGQSFPAGPLWHAVAIGFMANNLLPFRAGELIRTFTATRLTTARFTSAVSSVAVERIFDGLTVVGLLTFALFASGLPPDAAVGGVPIRRGANIAGAIALATLVAAGLVLAFPALTDRMTRGIIRHAGTADRVVALVGGLRHGMTALQSPARLAGVLVWSLVLWLVNALAFYVCFAAFDIQAPFAGALLLQGLLVLGIALPSTPGFVGVFEAAIVASLGFYAIPKDLAFSYAVTFHVTTFLPIILLGAWSLAQTPMRLRDLRRSPT